jgi:hypothetical protein
VRRWLLFAVAFPFSAWLLARVADRIAERRGEDRVTALLRAPQRLRQARRQA